MEGNAILKRETLIHHETELNEGEVKMIYQAKEQLAQENITKQDTYGSPEVPLSCWQLLQLLLQVGE